MVTLFEKVRDALDSSLFVIRIKHSRAMLTKGKLTARFLAELSELAADSGIKFGVIRGRPNKGYIRVSFSRIAPELHQRLRNLWHIHEPRA